MASGKRVEPNVPLSLSETPSHFFKIMLPSNLKDKKMGIPKKFVAKFVHDLSDVATLIVLNSSCWRVALEKDGRNIWFGDGWHEFVESHSISSEYFIVFKYEKNSIFHVVIFDLTTCEINYPYKYEESENMKWNSEFLNDVEMEDSEQIIGAATPNHPSSSSQRKHFDKCPRKRVFRRRNSSSALQNQVKDALGSSRPIIRNFPFAVSRENSKVKHKSEPNTVMPLSLKILKFWSSPATAQEEENTLFG